MHTRCPHCHNPIEVVNDTSLTEICCPSCGSSFSLISGETTVPYRAQSRRIAHFELVRELGIGKFGSVWMARDTELDRTVAIKIPRKGTLDADDAEIFLRDARAAAQLKHPNIVGVHEVGREDGTVYIVSDYVEGANLREWLSGQQLSFRESAELVVKLAEALHHAHESGVVHRDLKPGNIMIDHGGQPHVIDFGLAKRDAGEITMTVDGHILGTPAYMSPEQAKGKGHDADRRSDVYSLGVILFELLTGELPFRGETQMLLLQIQRDEPPRPRRLNARIPRDLETIALKCLEKEPVRRYQTSEQMAADLKSWLNGKPILARPVGRIGRGWKWCTRNRAAAALGAALVVSLLTGTILSTVYAIRANEHAERERAANTVARSERERAEANLAEATRERDRAEVNLAEATRQRQRASSAFEQARSIVDHSLTSISEDKLVNEPGLQQLRKEMLETAQKYYERFVREQGDDDPHLRAELARTHFRVGNIRHLTGQLTDAVNSYRKAIEMQEILAQEATAMLEDKRQQQLPLHQWLDAVYDTRYKLAATYNNLGIVQYELGQRSDLPLLTAIAEESLRKSIEVYEGLPNEWRADLGYRSHLGALAAGYNNIGIVQSELHRPVDADTSYAKAIEIAKKEGIITDGFIETNSSFNLARMYNNLGNLQTDTDRLVAAAESFRKAIQFLEFAAQKAPGVVAYLSDLAICYNNFGVAQSKSDRKTDAEQLYAKAIEIQDKLAQANPAVPGYRRDLALSRSNLDKVQTSVGKSAKTDGSHSNETELAQILGSDDPLLAENRAEGEPAYRNLPIESDEIRILPTRPPMNSPLMVGKSIAKEILSDAQQGSSSNWFNVWTAILIIVAFLLAIALVRFRLRRKT